MSTGLNLNQAAEALAKAAVQHTQETNLALSKEAVAEIKRVAAFTEKAAGCLTKLQTEMTAVPKQLEARLAKLEGDVAELKVSTEEIRKLALMQVTQWAIVNAEISQFEFRDCNNSYSSTLKSGSFVREALLLFNKNIGRWIPNTYYVGGNYTGSVQAAEESRQAFHKALSTQIEKLTGIKPRIAKEKNGDVEQYAIYRQ